MGRITRLTLICHGSTAALRAAAFPDDDPLDDGGAADLGALASSIRGADRVWSSPARAARQSAAALGLQALPEPLLGDADCGRWAGRSLADLAAAEPEALAAWRNDPDAAPHGGESMTDVLRRVAGWLDGQGETPGRVVAVTHASVVRAAVVHALGAPPASVWRLDAAPLSRTVLHGHGHGDAWRVSSVNETIARRGSSRSGNAV